MAIDHSYHGSSPSSKKGRPAMSKKEMKMALVANRLAMLQDNDDAHHAQPVSYEISSQHESESIKETREKNVDKLLVSDDAPPQICGSAKPEMDVSDYSSLGDVVTRTTANRRKHGSHQRSKVISDDESVEDKQHYVWIPPTKKERTKRKRVLGNDFVDHEHINAPDAPSKRRNIKVDSTDDSSTDENLSTMKRAKEFRANLSKEFPSFVKLMLPSHVSRVHWLHLPKKFCDEYLPMSDSTVVLVDEAGKKFDTNFLVRKTGLSGGWRAFAVQHKLNEGDVLVFHLIAPTTFQVYIVSKDNHGEVDGALGLLTLDAGAEQWRAEDHAQKVLTTTEDHSLMDYLSPANSDVDTGPEVLDGIRFSDCTVDFEAVKGFENFNITVNGLVIDSQFPPKVREKYYKLCCCQKAFLHEHLLEGLNCKLIVGIISETVNIADAIGLCKGSTILEDLQIWEKTLRGFELLGMKVAFLLDKLNQLLGIDSELDVADESNLFKMCMLERVCANERMKALENKLTELKGIMKSIDMEMEAEIMSTSVKHEAKIKEIANSL